MDPGLLARLRDPRIRPIAFGEPKSIAADGGIAEVAGPGMIQRIVLNVSRTPAGTLQSERTSG